MRRARGDMRRHTLEKGGADRRLEDRGELDQDAVLLGQIGGKARRRGDARAGHEDLDPVIGGGERQFDLGDDPVGAVGMADARQFLAAEFEDAGLGLHRHHAQADDVAQVAQRAPAHRADTARAARDEAADGGGGGSRGHHAQFLPRMGAGFGIQIADHAARFGDHPAAASPGRNSRCPRPAWSPARHGHSRPSAPRSPRPRCAARRRNRPSGGPSGPSAPANTRRNRGFWRGSTPGSRQGRGGRGRLWRRQRSGS